eukprot:6213585-Pleurochrysis_carterae.AAC.4
MGVVNASVASSATSAEALRFEFCFFDGDGNCDADGDGDGVGGEGCRLGAAPSRELLSDTQFQYLCNFDNRLQINMHGVELLYYYCTGRKLQSYDTRTAYDQILSNL